MVVLTEAGRLWRPGLECEGVRVCSLLLARALCRLSAWPGASAAGLYAFGVLVQHPPYLVFPKLSKASVQLKSQMACDW